MKSFPPRRGRDGARTGRGAGWLFGAAATLALPALSQEPGRGAILYLQLPGGQASCVECHGPDPLGNRNRLLNAAGGPAVITQAIGKAAAMGYLGTVLTDADRRDLSAYLERVNAQESASVVIWPRVVEFGRVAQGAAVAEQRVALSNLGATAVGVAPRLDRANGVSLRHDCPESLPPGASCTAYVGLATGTTGALSAAVVWHSEGDWAPQWVGVSGRVDAMGAGVLVADSPVDTIRLEASPGATVVREFALVNAGAAPLTLGVPAITGPGAAAYGLSGSGCTAATVLAPSARCTVRLSARAPALGSAWAQLQWRGDGADLVPLRLEVAAVGSAPPPAAPTPEAPPPAGPPVSPAPPPATNPAPPAPSLPPPAAAAPAAAGGGGCAVALQPGRADPLLPALLMAALIVLGRRRHGRALSSDAAGTVTSLSWGAPKVRA